MLAFPQWQLTVVDVSELGGLDGLCYKTFRQRLKKTQETYIIEQATKTEKRTNR